MHCQFLTTRTADNAASALSPNGRRRRRRQNRRRSEDDAARRARFDLEDTALLGEAAASKRGVVLRKLERPFHNAAAAKGTSQCYAHLHLALQGTESAHLSRNSAAPDSCVLNQLKRILCLLRAGSL
jgi:hypothetical protein